MTINLTFNSYEEMQEFCKTAGSPAPATVEVTRKKPAKKAEAPEEVPFEEEPVEKKSISIEEVRKAAGEYIKRHGKDALIDLLKEWDAKNITSLAEEHYAAFLRKVGE